MPSNKDIGVADPLFAHYDATAEAPAALPSTCAMTDQRPHAQAMVALAAMAAGSVRLVGRAIYTYNEQVDELNAQWRTAKAGDLDARLELVTRLERAHREARREFDAAIATATRRLVSGPAPEVLRELVATATRRRPSRNAKGGLS